MLGGAMHHHCTSLAGHRQRHLTFQVKMLLPTHPHGVFDAMRRPVDYGSGITFEKLVRPEHFGPTGQPLLYIYVGRLYFDFEPRQLYGVTCLVTGARHHGEDHLPVK